MELQVPICVHRYAAKSTCSTFDTSRDLTSRSSRGNTKGAPSGCYRRKAVGVSSRGAGAPVKECAWCMVRHAQAASKAFYSSTPRHTITLCPSVGTYVDRVRSAEVL